MSLPLFVVLILLLFDVLTILLLCVFLLFVLSLLLFVLRLLEWDGAAETEGWAEYDGSFG